MNTLRTPALLRGMILSLFATCGAHAATDEAAATGASGPGALEPDMRLTGKQWKLDLGGFQLQLTEFPLDSVRAFFQGRGFTSEQSDRIANSCVFQTIGRNTLPATDKTPVSFDTRRWRIVDADGEHPLKLRPTWQTLWQQAEVARPAQVAFQWALFPTEQTYHSGDYNWGMLTIGPAPGSRFDLKLEWTLGDEQFSHTLKDIECPTE